jgi:hypothetical protein
MPIPVMTTRRCFNMDPLDVTESQDAIEAVVKIGAAQTAPRRGTLVCDGCA